MNTQDKCFSIISLLLILLFFNNCGEINSRSQKLNSLNEHSESHTTEIESALDNQRALPDNEITEITVQPEPTYSLTGVIEELENIGNALKDFNVFLYKTPNYIGETTTHLICESKFDELLANLTGIKKFNSSFLREYEDVIAFGDSEALKILNIELKPKISESLANNLSSLRQIKIDLNHSTDISYRFQPVQGNYKTTDFPHTCTSKNEMDILINSVDEIEIAITKFLEIQF